jgi:hypothetical protein
VDRRLGKIQRVIDWIMALMLAAQPDAPWKRSYRETAAAIAAVVESSAPLFEAANGESEADAQKKTAALLVAIAWAESRFNAQAIGDSGKSVGLYQLFETNVPTPEGFQRTDILGHPDNATRVAYRMLRYSLEFCAKFPSLNRLGAYTGGTCTGERAVWASQYRMKLAMRLYQEHREEASPSPQTDTTYVSAAVPVLTPAPVAPTPAPEQKPREQSIAPSAAGSPKRTAERKPSVRRRVEVPRDPVDESQLPVFRLTPEETRRIEGKAR